MRKLLLLLAIIPSFASAQAYTQNQINGLIKALNDSVAAVGPGNMPTISANQLVTFGGTVTAGTPCIRCTIRLDEQKRLFLGLPAGTIVEPSDLYAVMQVCGTATAVDQKMPDWMEELVQTCSKTVISAQAGWSKVTLADRKNPVAQAAATGFSCACSPGIGTCNWTPPLPGGGVGAVTPAPKGFTIPAGLWSGSACVLKPCVEMFGFESMPNACK